MEPLKAKIDAVRNTDLALFSADDRELLRYLLETMDLLNEKLGL